MKFLLLLLSISQINILLWHINRDHKRMLEMHQLHRRVLIDGRRAMQQYCSHPNRTLEVHIRSGYEWEDACRSESLIHYRGPRYWRLLVSNKYEILGLLEASNGFTWTFYR